MIPKCDWRAHSGSSCGEAAAAVVLKWHGVDGPATDRLSWRAGGRGASLGEIAATLEASGLEVRAELLTWQELTESEYPAIVVIRPSSGGSELAHALVALPSPGGRSPVFVDASSSSPWRPLSRDDLSGWAGEALVVFPCSDGTEGPSPITLLAAVVVCSVLAGAGLGRIRSRAVG